MKDAFDRRELLTLAGVGGVVFMSGLSGCMPSGGKAKLIEDFFFVQMSDTHWGYRGPANPEADVTLPNAVKAVNALTQKPDFIIFTGDLTHSTDDVAERQRRMIEFKEITNKLDVKNLYFIPGEHDASLDNGQAYKDIFGQTHYSFNHKGIHFIALDNVSDPRGKVGDEQLAWLKKDLENQAQDQRIVVFAHRPLFDLYPSWDWATKDGKRVVDLLLPFANVAVFYGHIHQEHLHNTDHIFHHSAKSLIFPLPAPGSVPERKALPWNEDAEDHGIGFRLAKSAKTLDESSIEEFEV